jgi:MFS family permease
MTDRGQQGSPNSDPKVAPETLELRARPQPVTRINRKVVIGAAAVLLCLISFIVLLALKPPSLRVAGPQELFNVEHKPVTDALSKLPASYDGIRPDKKTDPAKQPAYFLVFAAVLPCGVLLDRYGPRLIDSALLLLAAAGSIVFALANGVWTLMIGRALIGLGVAVGLMAGLKAIVLWFPPERVALANGWYIMLGALGAVSATGPAELVVQSVGWRGLFAMLALASAAVALLILLVVPEKKQSAAAGPAPKMSFSTIFRDPRFWRIAPLGATGVGISWSLQGLWAAPWLTDVAGLDRSAVVEHLTLMAAVLSASALLLGALAERLRRAGISTEMFLAGTIALSMAAQLALVLGVPVSSHLLFAIIAAAGATTVLSFAILARYFPKEMAGRANAALGVLNMGTAFALQCLGGFIVDRWPAAEGHYPADAHQAAMAAGLILQLVALGVFFTPKPRRRAAPMAHAVVRALGFSGAPSRIVRPAYSSWTHQAEIARRQRAAWRFAAAASAALCAGLAATLSITISRPAVALHVIELSRPGGLSN